MNATTLLQLSEDGLHASVAELAELLLFSSAATITEETRLVATVVLADALFAQEEMQRAEHYYRQCLQKSQHESFRTAAAKHPKLALARIRHQMARCLQSRGAVAEALSVLKVIPAGERTPQIHMLLAGLLARDQRPVEALAAVKDVLRTNPLALDAITLGVKLGLPQRDLALLLRGRTAGDDAWLQTWIQAQYHVHGREHKEAAHKLKQLEEKHFSGYPGLLRAAGVQEWKSGNLSQARQLLELAHARDPLCLADQDVHAHVLYAAGAVHQLAKLCNTLLAADRRRPEAWVALARMCLLHADNSTTEANTRFHARRGLTFADRAVEISNSSVEAHLVKGGLLAKLQKFREAIAEFRCAMQSVQDFVAFEGLVNCYLDQVPLTQEQLAEALKVAQEATRLLPSSAMPVALLAKACARCRDGAAKAQRLYETALRRDPACMGAALGLVDLMLRDQRLPDAAALLTKYVHVGRPEVIYCKLGEVAVAAGNVPDAHKFYSSALSANAEHAAAKEGLSRVSKMLNGAAEADAAEGEEEEAEAREESGAEDW